jgi:chemotaxis signal transduction protein
MKNVIVFAAGKQRYAVELRWVREVLTLGYVTHVPLAPPGILGAVNIHGAIVPVVDVPALERTDDADSAAAAGDGAILVDVDRTRFALRIDNVEEVSTLREHGRDRLLDSRGLEAIFLDPPELIDRLTSGGRHAGGAAGVD